MVSRFTTPLFIFCLAALSSAMANRAMDPLVSEVARDFDIAIATAATVVSAFAFPYALAQPVLGPVGDYYGKGRMLRAFMWLQCVSLLVVVLSPTFAILFIARFLGGIASGAIMPAAMAAVGDRYPPAERQQKIGTLVSVALIGFTFSSAAAGILAVYVSWRAIFAITLVFAIGAAIMLRLVVEKTPRPEKPMQASDAIAGYKLLFSNPRAKFCYGAVFLEGLAMWGTLPYISPILEARGAGGPGEAGLIITAMSLGAFLLTATVKHWLKLFTPYQLMFLGGFLTAIGPIVLAYDLDWRWFAAAFALSGLGFMMVHNSIQAEVAALAPSVRGSAFAMHSCWLFVGHSFGPLLFALGLKSIGELPMLYVFGLTLLVIGPAISIAFSRMAPSAEP